MGMTYTQLSVNDWDRYATENWMSHYEKDLATMADRLQCRVRTILRDTSSTRESDGLSVTEVLEAYMVNGGTVQIHLGPYRNEYQPNRLPFGMDIAMRTNGITQSQMMT